MPLLCRYVRFTKKLLSYFHSTERTVVRASRLRWHENGPSQPSQPGYAIWAKAQRCTHTQCQSACVRVCSVVLCCVVLYSAVLCCVVLLCVVVFVMCCVMLCCCVCVVLYVCAQNLCVL